MGSHGSVVVATVAWGYLHGARNSTAGCGDGRMPIQMGGLESGRLIEKLAILLPRDNALQQRSKLCARRALG